MGEESLRFLLTNLSPRYIPSGKVTLKNLFSVVREKGTVSVLAFDFDKIPLNKSKLFLDSFLMATTLSLSEIGVVHTGNGLHIYIPVNDSLNIEDFSYLQEKYYEIIYKRIALVAGLTKEQRDTKGLKYWSSMGRVPLTSNTKVIFGQTVTTRVYPLNVPNNPKMSWAQLYTILMRTDINIRQVVESRKIKLIGTTEAQDFSREDWKDTPLKECDVVKYCLTNPNDVPEPMWFDVIRILKEDPHGLKLVHKISERYDGYDSDETEKKYQLADRYAPPSCAQMHVAYNKCHSCKHYRSTLIYRPTHLLSQKKWSIVINNKFRKINAKGVLTENLDVNLLGLYLIDFFGAGIRVSSGRQDLYTFKSVHWEKMSREELMARFIIPLTGMIVQNVDIIKKEVYSALCLVALRLTGAQEGGDPGKYYFLNGIFDVNTGTWTEHSEKNSATFCLNYNYGPEDSATSRQTFTAYLRGLLYREGDDESIGRGRERLLQEHVGNIFSRRTPDGNNRCLFIFGPSDNGKSKFFNIVRYILGNDNIWALDICNMDEKCLAEMSECYLALDADYSESYGNNKRMRHDGSFKKVVTGDPIMVRRPYYRPESKIVKAKLVVLSNGLLTTTDKSEGFYKRFSLLKFPNTFIVGGEGDEPGVDLRIFNECRDTFFNWALEGYRRLRANNFVFSLGPDDTALKEETRKNNDPIYFFMREKLSPLQGADIIPRDNIYRLFIAWQGQEGLNTRITKRRFVVRLNHLLSRFWPKMQEDVDYYDYYGKNRVKGELVQCYRNMEII